MLRFPALRSLRQYPDDGDTSEEERAIENFRAQKWLMERN
jgi:hypothetical protein